MSVTEQIARSLKQITKQPGEMYSTVCVVDSVDVTARTCKAIPVDGKAEIFDVRLQANLNMALGIVSIPKEGSHIVVTWLNKEAAYVALTTEIEKVIITCDQAEMILSKDGFSMKSSTSTLRAEVMALSEIINDLIGTLESFELNTTGAPGPTVGVMPGPLASLQQHKAALQQFNQNIQTIIAA
jgi:hypothetical protein